MYSRYELEAFVAQAISGDILAQAGGGFVSVMANSAPAIQKDIPVAFEMYTLLEHFLKSLPIRQEALGYGAQVLDLEPGIVVDRDGHKVIALLPIQANQLADVAFWLADALPSREVKAMPGMLALMFTVETHDDSRHLLPEWMAAFYVQGEAGHCVPILALKSVLEDERFGGDWVAVAVHRLAEFALPQADALQAAGAELKTTR
ncbi:hypothetical protein F3J44_15010 [Pantoea sp. Tr-811]|uniref:hypothetical protein n=1 Tax=Pantoea sp. Tr-811 TaxID=2608361 RepID=UPI001421B95A|nr:hypothetical protein [Pantoea sp. Tr-811]NIF27678.1 hypothetical protein [Pantoea sp. Tr-811]